MNGGRILARIVTLGFLTGALAQVGHADPAGGVTSACAGVTAEKAKSVADELYRRANYQEAGECYQVAGDMADANEAFVKAVHPNSDATAKDLQRQGQIAKTLFTSVQQAFRSNH